MANYNVNMKQWNGTSFDNVLPLAYDSNKIDGKTWAQVTQLLLEKSGGTMTGDLILNGDPTAALQAVTKQYVDGYVDGKANNVEIVNWVGNGSSSNTKTFSQIKPDVILVTCDQESYRGSLSGIFTKSVTTIYYNYNDTRLRSTTADINGSTVEFTPNSSAAADTLSFNLKNVNYSMIGIELKY